VAYNPRVQKGSYPTPRNRFDSPPEPETRLIHLILKVFGVIVSFAVAVTAIVEFLKLPDYIIGVSIVFAILFGLVYVGSTSTSRNAQIAAWGFLIAIVATLVFYGYAMMFFLRWRGY
jgi:hypothetical protein